MKSKLYSACIDSNVYISAICFGGKPLKILELALDRKFHLITSELILNEVSKNLNQKMQLTKSKVEALIDDVMAVSSIYHPTGKIKIATHIPDNLVLETAKITEGIYP